MRHTIARDGIVAGILGATAVALWFLGLDVIYRHAFATPEALGRGLLRILGPQGREGSAVFVISCWIGRAMQNTNEAVLFMIALWLIVTSTLGGRGLVRLARAWKQHE